MKESTLVSTTFLSSNRWHDSYRTKKSCV